VNTSVNASEHAESVLTGHRGRLTWGQAVLIAYSETDGNPLDPCDSDDAAVLLRAEQLVEGGTTVREAIAQARDELRASRRGVGALREGEAHPGTSDVDEPRSGASRTPACETSGKMVCCRRCDPRLDVAAFLDVVRDEADGFAGIEPVCVIDRGEGRPSVRVHVPPRRELDREERT
jgi:hypothetical protein